MPEKIASLVYLDAFLPENGDTLFGIVPTGPQAVRPSPIAGADWLVAPPPVEAFGEPTEIVRAFAARKMSAHPLACFTQPLRLTGDIDRVRRKDYIYCNDPQPTTLTPFYEKVRNKPGWTVHTLPCTHNVQFDMPEELTALLLRVVPS